MIETLRSVDRANRYRPLNFIGHPLGVRRCDECECAAQQGNDREASLSSAVAP